MIFENGTLISIAPACMLDIADTRTQALAKLFTSNGRMIPIWNKEYYIKKHGLTDLLKSLAFHMVHYTAVAFVENLYRFLSPERFLNQNSGLCCNCKKPTTFINYRKGYNKFCSRLCNGVFNAPTKNETPEARRNRGEKISHTNKGREISVEWKQKLKISANKMEVKEKKRATCLERYGIENPGVLGAYSSKAAHDYIIQFLAENEISESRCLFKTETTSEFFQMVDVSFKDVKRYVSYDLVVFKTEDAKEQSSVGDIELVLEYNGPWHYHPLEIIGKEDEPATPYPKSLTKEQSVEMDRVKWDRITEIAPNAKKVIYWERTKVTDHLN